MAWWDTLAKVGGFAAAPFTGGASLWPTLAMTGIGVGGGILANKLASGGKDEKPSTTPYTQQLEQSAQQNQAQGREFSGMSSEALGPVLQYFKQLMGGDPSALMDATRQERGRVIDQYDTARRAIANFGPRGGGTTSALAESRFAQAESLADITSGARRDAAANLADLGPQLAALGLSSQQLASQDLNSIINTILTREGFDVQKRGQNMEAAGAAGEAAATLLGIWLTRDKGKGATA